MDYGNFMSAEEIYAALKNCSESALSELQSMGFRDGMTQEELIFLFQSCSETTFNEITEIGVFGQAITFNQIAQLCSGVDADGIPNSYGAMQIDTILPDMTTVTYESLSLGAPVINIYGSGGCIVVTADFAPHASFEFRQAKKMLEKWSKKREDPDFRDKIFSFAISPVLLDGAVMVILHDFVFAQGCPNEDGGKRLIIAFDGNQAQEFVESGVNLSELKREVESEMERQRQEFSDADQSYTGEGESGATDEGNVYEQFLEEQYQSSNLLDGMNADAATDSDNSESGDRVEWMRISKD